MGKSYSFPINNKLFEKFKNKFNKYYYCEKHRTASFNVFIHNCTSKIGGSIFYA